MAGNNHPNRGRAARRLRDASGQLLEALEDCLPFVETALLNLQHVSDDQRPKRICQEIVAKAKKAIAAAKTHD